MKNIITLITLISLITFFTACDFEGYITKESGVMSFRLDSSGIDKGYYTLENLRTGTFKGHTMIDAVRSVDQEGADLYELRFSHFDNSFKGKGVYTNIDDLLETRFILMDTTDKNHHPSYFFEIIDSLRLEYTKVDKEWIEGEFYLKVRSNEEEIDENVVYTLTEGKFEFTDKEHKF